MGLLDRFKIPSRRQAVRSQGAPSINHYGGYLTENEKDKDLVGLNKYRTYSYIIADCPVAAAGVRHFLNLCAEAEWAFEPNEKHPRGKELAERAKRMLTQDPKTSWGRIVRRAAMYRFYGFSLQEWTMRRDNDGYFTFDDIAPRAQATIEKWNIDKDGEITGVVQRSPQTGQEHEIMRGKLVYFTDDSVNDSPQGLGLFRHITNPVKRLKRYEQLEAFGFETDLRGVPVGKLPYGDLRQKLENKDISQEEFEAQLKPLQEFIRNHIKNPQLGLTLDSEPWLTTDDASKPSTVHKFALELLKGSSTGLPDIATAIERTNREIARVLGVEALLLGEGNRGSFALARDKTNQFSLIIKATLKELALGFEADLLHVLWAINGWPEKALPTLKPEAVQYRDTEQIGSVLFQLSQAGALLMPDDPVVNDVREALGVSLTDLQEARKYADEVLTRENPNPSANSGKGTGSARKPKPSKGVK